MSIAVTQREQNFNVWGRCKVNVVRVAFSGDYATGGEAFDPTLYGVSEPIFVAVSARDDSTTTNVLVWDAANEKIIVFESGASGAALAEKTNSEAHVDGLEADVLIIGY